MSFILKLNCIAIYLILKISSSNVHYNKDLTNFTSFKYQFFNVVFQVDHLYFDICKEVLYILFITLAFQYHKNILYHSSIHWNPISIENVKLSSYYSERYRRSFVPLVVHNIRAIADWRIAHEINICIL